MTYKWKINFLAIQMIVFYKNISQWLLGHLRKKIVLHHRLCEKHCFVSLDGWYVCKKWYPRRIWLYMVHPRLKWTLLWAVITTLSYCSLLILLSRDSLISLVILLLGTPYDPGDAFFYFLYPHLDPLFPAPAHREPLHLAQGLYQQPRRCSAASLA